MHTRSHPFIVWNFFVTFCLVTFFIPLFALGQEFSSSSTPTIDGTQNTNRADFREVMQEKREQYENGRNGSATTSDVVRAKVLERRGQFSEGVKNRVKNLLSNIENRMLASVNRFERIITRVESRMKKLESEGMDVQNARASLEIAKMEIDSAKTILAQTGDADIDVVVDDTSPREKFAALREKIKTILSHIKNAHEALRNTVLILKGAVPPVTNSATSSPIQE